MLGIVSSLLGSVASGVMGMFGQNSANQQAHDNMMEQERFATEMPNTAYQRASIDMQKAGLNPAAMFGSGGPASTPGVQQAPVQNAMAPLASSIGNAVASATQQMTAEKTIENLVAQNAQIQADTRVKDANVANILAALPGVKSDTDVKVRSNNAIKAIPDPVYVPLVQGGFGADTMKNTGDLGAIGGAAAASAKSVAQGVSEATAPVVSGLSGPSINSAGAISHIGELKNAFENKWPSLRDAVYNWWNDSGSSTMYKTGTSGSYHGN